MTISVVLPDLRGGGTERTMVTLTAEWAKRGYDVEFVLQRGRGEFLDAVDPAVDIVSLDALEYPGYAALGALSKLERYIVDTEPKVILSCLARMNVVTLLAWRLARVESRVIVSERNHLSTWLDHGGIRYQLFPALMGRTYPMADEVIAVSTGVADNLTERIGIDRQTISVIPNPAYTRQVKEGRSDAVDHAWFDLADTPVLINVGSLTEQKDHRTLLEAFSKVTEHQPAKLAILGEGTLRDDIEAQVVQLGIEDDLWLPGFIDNPYPYMANADLFVLSSRWEGLPNVLIEALGCGTPIVSTNCPSGPRDILQGGTYGTLTPVGDPESMASAILTALETPSRAEELIERAEDFSAENVANQYLEVLLPTENSQ